MFSFLKNYLGRSGSSKFKDKISKFFPFGGNNLASLDPNPLTQLNPGPIRPIRIQSNNRKWQNLRTYGYREVLKWGSRVTSVTQQIVSHLGNRFSFCSFRWKPFPAHKKRFSHHLASASFFPSLWSFRITVIWPNNREEKHPGLHILYFPN
jgi:hypothetical protein